MTTTCTRRIQFAAGHRVLGHEGKCANPHGHNYVALITAEAPQLDALGRVVDFGVIKSAYTQWIEQRWDHGFIFHEEDGEMLAALAGHGWKFYSASFNPTAEEMAAWLLRIAPQLVRPPVRVVKVQLWETENCFAEVTL